jgi:hypothetical protein
MWAPLLPTYALTTLSEEAFQAGILKSGTVRAPITGFLSSRS